MDIISNFPPILELFNKNNDDTKNKILSTISSPPAQTDGTGWIYGFYSPKDKFQSKNNFWIKMGRTERNPFHRVEREWGGEMVFCLKTSYNYKLERLVHLFFDFAREERKGICNDAFDPTKCKTISTQTDNTYKTAPSKWEQLCDFFSCLCCTSIKTKENEKILNNIELADNLANNKNSSPHAEREWFHFTEIINIPYWVSQLWSMVELSYGGSLLKSSSLNNEEEVSKININTATFDELITLPYIGNVIALKIIDHRAKNKFTCIDELKNIHKGLQFKIDKIKNKICV